MSKRVQESTLKEGSAVAKPRPMNLGSKNLLSAKKDLPQELSDPNSLGIQEHQRRGTPEFIQYHSEVDLASLSGDSACENDLWTSRSFTRCTLSHDQVIKWTKARERVCSAFVLMLGEGMSDNSEANRRWEGQVK